MTVQHAWIGERLQLSVPKERRRKGSHVASADTEDGMLHPDPECDLPHLPALFTSTRLGSFLERGHDLVVEETRIEDHRRAHDDDDGGGGDTTCGQQLARRANPDPTDYRHK